MTPLNINAPHDNVFPSFKVPYCDVCLQTKHMYLMIYFTYYNDNIVRTSHCVFHTFVYMPVMQCARFSFSLRRLTKNSANVLLQYTRIYTSIHIYIQCDQKIVHIKINVLFINSSCIKLFLSVTVTKYHKRYSR